MCFYYSITKKSINTLVKGKIIKENQLSLFEEHYIVSGFDHPRMPIITDDNPEEIQHLQWGFMPQNVTSFEQAQEFLKRYNTLNAKAEDITDSKLYSESYQSKRCLVLCSGFFEWRKVKKQKIPYYVTLKNDEMFVFAGVWNETTDSKGNKYRSFSVLTVDANELMANIHNTKKRMPLILTPEQAQVWIDINSDTEMLQSIVKPIPSNHLKAHSIKKFVPSNSKNLDTSDLIAYYNYPEVFGLLSEQETLL